MEEEPFEPQTDQIPEDILAMVRAVVPFEYAPPRYADGYERNVATDDRPEPDVLSCHPFKGYVRSYTDDTKTEANMWTNEGMILTSDSDIEAIAPIEDIDKSFIAKAGYWGWIETYFTATGVVTGCIMKVAAPDATWPSYPALYGDVSAAGNTWYHPLWHITSPVTAKSIEAGLPDAPFPDRGFFPVINGSMHIDQLTHTHLKTEQRCVEGAGLIWTLVPGPGGAR